MLGHIRKVVSDIDADRVIDPSERGNRLGISGFFNSLDGPERLRQKDPTALSNAQGTGLLDLAQRSGIIPLEAVPMLRNMSLSVDDAQAIDYSLQAINGLRLSVSASAYESAFSDDIRADAQEYDIWTRLTAKPPGEYILARRQDTGYKRQDEESRQRATREFEAIRGDRPSRFFSNQFREMFDVPGLFWERSLGEVGRVMNQNQLDEFARDVEYIFTQHSFPRVGIHAGPDAALEHTRMMLSGLSWGLSPVGETTAMKYTPQAILGTNVPSNARMDAMIRDRYGLNHSNYRLESDQQTLRDQTWFISVQQGEYWEPKTDNAGNRIRIGFGPSEASGTVERIQARQDAANRLGRIRR